MSLISIMMIISLIAIGLSSLRSTDLAILNNELDGLKAFYLAESALNVILNDLKTNPGLLNSGLGSQVLIYPESIADFRRTCGGNLQSRWESARNASGQIERGKFTLIGEGVVGKIDKEARMDTETFYPFGYALVHSRVILSANSRIQIKGDTLYSSSVYPRGVNLAQGYQVYQVDDLTSKMPQPNFEKYKEKATVVRNDNVYRFYPGGQPYRGLYYCRDQVTIENGTTIEGTVVARCIHIHGRVNINPDANTATRGYPALVGSHCVCFFSSHNSVVDGLIYGGQYSWTFHTNNITFNKGIIAGEIKTEGLCSVNINDNIEFVPPFFEYEVTKGYQFKLDLEEWRCN